MQKEMSITMLGTGNALVRECYNTCFAIDSGEGMMLVDAGGGNRILNQLEKAGISLCNLDAMFLTHSHTDHILGAVWIVRMISTAIHRGERQKEFRIYSHQDSAEVLEFMVRRMLPKKIASEWGRGVRMCVVGDGESFFEIGARFTAFSIHSTKLVQYGFCMEKDGKRVCCLGDEPFNEQCRMYAQDADWMLCEAFCLYEDRDTFHPYEKHHSTARDAGRQAEQLGVGNLLLYHTEEKTLRTRKERYSAEAGAEFGGRVFVPDDLERIVL